MIKAIIFDAYGTLISSSDGSVRATKRILDKLALPYNAREFYAEWKVVHRENITLASKEFISEEEIYVKDLAVLFRRYGISADPRTAVVDYIDSLYGRKAFDETREVLEKLGKSYQLVVGSTSDTEPLIKNIQENQLVFDRVFTSEYLKSYKPQREFYLKILNEIGLKSSEVVFVGDSLLDDVFGPKQVGIYSIWLNRKGEEDLKGIADSEIEHLGELEYVLSEL